MRQVLRIPSASYVLPIPPREDSNSLMVENLVENRRATSGFTHQYHRRPHNLIMDESGAELESSLTRALMILFPTLLWFFLGWVASDSYIGAFIMAVRNSGFSVF